MILLLPFKLACYKHQRVRGLSLLLPVFSCIPPQFSGMHIFGVHTQMTSKLYLRLFFCCRTAFMKHVKAIAKEIHGSLIAEQNRNTVTFGLIIGIVSVPKPTFLAGVVPTSPNLSILLITKV